MAAKGTLVDEVDVEEVNEELGDDQQDEVIENTVDDTVDKNTVLDSDKTVEDDADSKEDGDTDDDGPVTLDALEAEELELVESDETATMLVDEASEIMAIRRAELALDVEADARQGDEFVCQSCFLVLKSTQLANKRKMLCVDCV